MDQIDLTIAALQHVDAPAPVRALQTLPRVALTAFWAHRPGLPSGAKRTLDITVAGLALRARQRTRLAFVGGHLLRQPIFQNIYGRDFSCALCAMLARGGHSLYLPGTEPGVAADVAAWVQQHDRGVRVLGHHHGDLTAATLGIGVGRLFDFYSGRSARAPQRLRELGAEWTFRLLQEPRRIWRRYLIGNPAFLLRMHHIELPAKEQYHA